MNEQQMKEIVVRYKKCLPDSVGTLLDMLGYEGLCGLSGLYGGSAIYIPKPQNLFSDCLRQSLVDEYDGANQRELKVKYGYSTRAVQKIVAKRIKMKGLS